ncbi:ERMES complex subunit MDM34 [Lachancea thermotolerans CBS 6340]|uniref:Mitochondrial distribution and morphology protein 34 n=1 Tax=Lachancea thermotolerans (strain ATCC 56472 / CBS 6340 / NRRL Y-8284) TaxID=559295 RepID=MDM34_LACTC|nr:KLTH0G01562p [Lachancea thermotolerans CBS 6340]C5DLL1.1 RecName: Full=Mitochondrial distribution and morphology protein 34 [Lachancea thermotolerans CBS 6340]CAR24672.1 KLTH0G01562p [Lachancea thermotolerans CBS 6340]
MSFRFNKGAFEDNSFNEQIREALTSALNSKTQSSSQTAPANTTNSAATDEVKQETRGPKRLDILKSGISVSKVNFPSTPQLEILDLDVSAQSRSLLKGICKVSCKNAMLEINTEIEANLLLLYTNDGPSFTTPRLISNDSFTVPITMTFNQIELEAITNIFVKNNSVGISFNDVNLDFDFDCSIKLLQSSIEKRLKGSMETVFKEVLPSVIFSMSQRWFTHGESTCNSASDDKSAGRQVENHSHTPRTILEDCDLEDLSPANMLRLSTLVSSRQSLSLNPTAMNTLSTIPGCLERQNLHRFNSRIPALSNFYPDFYEVESPHLKAFGRSVSTNVISSGKLEHHNALPQRVLDERSYDLKTIASVQSRIFERSSGDGTAIRRRKIKMGKKSKSKKAQSQDIENSSPTVVMPSSPSLEPSAVSTPEALHSPQPTTAVQSPELLAENSESVSIPALILPTQADHYTLPVKTSAPKLNLLEEAHYLNRKREFQKLRTSLYSPIRSNRFNLNKEMERPILEHKGLNFVGLTHGLNWGSEDLPPPYRG